MISKKLTLLIPSLIVTLILTILIMGLNNKGEAKQTVIQPKPFPNFQLNELQTGEEITQRLFQEKMHEQFRLLNIWASWCSVCKVEHPFLVKLAEQGVNIVGLNYRDNQLSATSVLSNSGNPYREIIFDPAGKLALDLGVIGTPETYLINKEGMIIGRFNGVLTPTIWATVFEPLIKKINEE